MLKDLMARIDHSEAKHGYLAGLAQLFQVQAATAVNVYLMQSLQISGLQACALLPMHQSPPAGQEVPLPTQHHLMQHSQLLALTGCRRTREHVSPSRSACIMHVWPISFIVTPITGSYRMKQSAKFQLHLANKTHSLLTVDVGINCCFLRSISGPCTLLSCRFNPQQHYLQIS